MNTAYLDYMVTPMPTILTIIVCVAIMGLIVFLAAKAIEENHRNI